MIADACEEWLSLLTADALKPHLMTVMKRFEEAVTDYHFLANFLHLKYKGKHLSEACEEWLCLLRADALKPHLTTVMK